jgi:FixJ family two-component response regulator
VNAPPAPDDAVVHVVDDDPSVRDALASLLRAVSLDVECFASAEEFLSRGPADRTSCLVLDVRLPGRSGLNIQDELARAGIRTPIIFITGHGDIPMTVRAMKAGAVEFLTKPFRDQDLLDAVQAALRQDRARRDAERSQAELRDRYATLTPREREVMALVADGLMNKQIADRIGIAEITVKIHRGQVTRKMGARSLAELVKMAQALDASDAS